MVNEASSTGSPHENNCLSKIDASCVTLTGYLFLFLSSICAALAISGADTGIVFWIAVFLFLYLFLSLLANYIDKQKAEVNLRSNLKKIIEATQDNSDQSLEIYKSEAVRYCKELIQYYKSSQQLFRVSYYSVQLSTIILSGTAPILTLMSKDDKYPIAFGLAVIFPALAGILAAISTSIPLQQNWITSKITRETLEAELEAFLLGTGDLYNVFDETNKLAQQRKAIENFITGVNHIHLQQITKWAELQLKSSAKAEESAKAKEPNQTH